MQPKSLLLGAAIGALVATGAYAQSQTADPAAPATAPGMMAPADTAAATGDWVTDGNYMPADLATLTAEQIIGADIHDANGEVIASVDDLVLGSDGKAESVAAKFGGFLGFGSNTVLLTLDEVEFMQNDSGQIALRTAVTPESLEGRPDYQKG